MAESVDMDWSGCELVEVVPGKVSGAPLLIGTRIPVAAIIDNYEAFLDEGSSPDEALAETLDCYPGAGERRLRDILAYDYSHETQIQA
jgi:uncharacterized protein (DUF433 family)